MGAIVETLQRVGRGRALIISALCIAGTATVGAQQPATGLLDALRSSPSYRITWFDTTFSNGFRVILAESRVAPVVAGELFVRVGSQSDPPGRDGLAHLIEHVAVDPALSRYEDRAGITSNASTGDNATSYTFTAPASSLDAALFVQSHLFRRFRIEPAVLEREKDVVVMESLQRNTDQAFGTSRVALDALYWTDSIAPPGAWERENRAVTLDEAQRFYDVHYQPSNAFLALAGDFDTREALALVRRYFADLPRGPAAPSEAWRRTRNVQSAERRDTVRDALARQTRLNIAFRTVPVTSREFPTVEVISALLAQGTGGILRQRLVDRDRLATQVEANVVTWRGAGAAVPLMIAVDVSTGVSPDSAITGVFGLLRELATTPVSDQLLERAKVELARVFIADTRNDGARGLAFNLGDAVVRFGTPSHVNDWLDRLAAVTVDDVMTVVRTYLTRDRTTTVLTLPASIPPSP